MQIQIIPTNHGTFAVIEADHLIMNDAQDALDLIANCNYQGASNIIIQASLIHPDFFNLKTGIAGEILQKFSTYDTQLAIVGEFSTISSKSLRDFIYESNKIGRILFVNSVAEAQEKWGLKDNAK